MIYIYNPSLPLALPCFGFDHDNAHLPPMLTKGGYLPPTPENKVLDLSQYGVHDIASALKQYLRTLPEPLFADSVCAELYALVGVDWPMEQRLQGRPVLRYQA